METQIRIPSSPVMTLQKVAKYSRVYSVIDLEAGRFITVQLDRVYGW